jgi:lysophospholipase L1-like esterase
MNGSRCPIGWGQWFENQFNANVEVVNSAIGARSVLWWKYDVSDTMHLVGENRGECIINTDGNNKPILQDRWAYMLENMKKGDYLFIQFGINDGDPNCPRHVGTGLYQTELVDMAATVQALGVHPIFLTPLSAIRCNGSKAVATRGFLTETFAAGSEAGVPVIDLHQLSIDLYNSKSFCPLPAGWTDIKGGTPGEVGAFFCDDHTHLDTPGAQAIAQLIADAIKEQSISLAAWLQ